MKTKVICKSKLLVVVSTFVILSSSIFLTGCTWDWMPGPEWAMFGDNRVNTSGANQLFGETFESIDLATLLDPEERAIKKFNGVDANDKLTDDQRKKYRNEVGDEKRVTLALAAFGTDYDNNTRLFRRNAVQERILAASDQRCGLFKTLLMQSSTRANFILGTTTTVLAGAGAIVTGGAINALSAGAAATSGVRAEYNQAYFRDLNLSVITSGIDLKRETIYDIIKVRQGEGYNVYNVEAAIRDAIKYHGACNMVEGISTAGEKMEDVGLDKFIENNIKIRSARSGTAPTAANHTVTFSEDTTYTFTATDFSYSEIGGAPMASVKVTTLETAGSLQFSGVDVTLNQEITKADIDAGKLTFAPVGDANGTGYDSFGFSVNDRTEDSMSSYTITVDVTAVNDSPTAANNTVTTNVNKTYTLTASDFNFSDIDGDTMVSVKITTLETVGSLLFSGVDVTLNKVIMKADIDAGKLEFVPVGGANGTGYDSFSFSVYDGTKDSMSTYAITVDVLL